MTISNDVFRRAMGCFATGVTVVTTAGENDVPYGLTVSAFTSVSLNPPMVAVCLNKGLSGLRAFQESGKFGVNILSKDQEAVSRHYSTKGTDRTAFLDGKGTTGVPLIRASMACLECSVVDSFEQGDHLVLFGEVEHASFPDFGREVEPLLYFVGEYWKLGDKNTRERSTAE